MITAIVQCPNSECGRLSHLGDDPLGRIFRCPRCLTKLPSAPAVGLIQDGLASGSAAAGRKADRFQINPNAAARSTGSNRNRPVVWCLVI